MLAHYQAQLEAITTAAADATKVDTITPYLHEGTALVTTYVSAPATQPADGQLPAGLRDATRIQPTIDPKTGQAHWNGTARGTATGKEYVVDLGDGFSAVYRPYAANNPKTTEYSLRGRLEVIAPFGEGHGPELVRRLGQLHLVNTPMTRAEGEWTYLSANVTAQELTDHPAVAKALTIGAHIEDMVRQELFHERAHQAIGLNDTDLARFAKTLQLQAVTRALPRKVTVLRDALAKATGHPTGHDLAASAGYHPAPRQSGGWLSWTRFDVGNMLPALRKKLVGKSLVHQVGGSLTNMLSTGVLASTERRATMGITPGLGKSENHDKFTGGASSVFLRLRPTDSISSEAQLVWDDPERLLARADYYGANADTFGNINPAKAGYYGSAKKSTRNPFTIAGFNHPANKVMFREGIDLLGSEAPSRIICSNTKQRDQIRAMLTAKGIHTLAGKPLSQVVIT